MKSICIFCLLILPLFTTAQVNEGVLLDTWSDPTLVGSTIFHNAYNEIWGFVANDKEYAVIGSTAGTHFIDVTDPNDISEIAFVAGPQMGPAVIHRDYHDYNGYLYAVCDEGFQSTLQIIDLAALPAGVDLIYDSNELLKTAHNIFIDESTARLYTLGTGSSNGFYAMKIFDISNPTAPTLLANHNNLDENNIGYVHDAYVKDNIAYLNCGSDGLYVMDFTSATNPVVLGSITDYPQSNYNHSGWPSEDGNHYYFSDEDHGLDVKAVDVSDFSDMTITSFFDAGPQASATSIPHNQVVAGNYLYVSYYYDGLQVYDLTDPAHPERILYYDTSSEADGNNFKGAWGVYPFLPSGNILVSDMQEGLFVIEAIEELVSIHTTSADENVLLELFPQPAKDQLNVRIELDKAAPDAALQLLDLMGRSVYHKSLNLIAGQNQLEVDEINSLAAGYYVLKIQGTDWDLVERVVIGR